MCSNVRVDTCSFRLALKRLHSRFHVTAIVDLVHSPVPVVHLALGGVLLAADQADKQASWDKSVVLRNGNGMLFIKFYFCYCIACMCLGQQQNIYI